MVIILLFLSRIQSNNTNILLMRKSLYILSTVLIVSCNMSNNSQTEVASTTPPIIMEDTTPRITGIGGVFFLSDNPQKTTKWYGENLGLVTDLYGAAFEFRNANNPKEINYLRWSPFKNNEESFAPSKKEFMINYRVQNILGLIRNLKKNGVIILDSIQEFEYGKFVHLMDPDGNKIELWEPNDSFFTKMGGATTK